MRKNKKASIISLEVLIGVVISIIIIVSAVTIISNFYRLSNSSKDSFNQLVALIEKVNQNNPGTIQSMPLRMDKGTAIIGFTKDDEKFEAMGFVGSQVGTPLIGNYFFPKPIDKGCKKDKACICLCRELDTEYEEGEIKCKDEHLICKTFEELEFSNPFLISKSLNFYEPKKDAKVSEFAQFKAVYVEKYNEYSENSVAVCMETEEDSCISQEYKEEKKAIYGLKKLKEFIESCKDREFAEDEKPCSCGAFDFKSLISEEYSVDFTKFVNSESNEESLKLILMKGKEEKSNIEIDTKLCIYKLKSNGDDSINNDLPKINLDNNLNPDYIFYYENYPDSSEVYKNYLEALKLEENRDNSPEDYKDYEDSVKKWQENRERYFQEYTDYKPENPHISFIKYDEDHICLAQYNSNIDDGYIKQNPDPEPFGTIWIMYKTSGDLIEDQVNKIKGCKYSITEE